MKKQRKKTNLGQSLIKNIKEAISYEEQKISLRTSALELPALPPTYNKSEVKKLREQLNVSQPVFAQIFGVSNDTVKSWERGANKPSGSSARLIQIAKKDPEAFIGLVWDLS